MSRSLCWDISDKNGHRLADGPDLVPMIYQSAIENPLQIMILLFISLSCDEHYVCSSSIDEIAHFCRWSPRSVIRSVQALEALGAIEIRRGTGRRNTNFYKLSKEWLTAHQVPSNKILPWEM